MAKKKPDAGDTTPRPSKRPADTSAEAYADDLTTAEILAHSPPAKPRRARKGDSTKNLGVYDADRDILDQYLYEVSTTPLLTAQQEIAIAKRVRAGDQEAMQELVKRNLRFVISVAKKYQNRGLPLIDLIGEGNVGLLTAARKFDPDQGVKFISYAVWWIRQAILASLARQGRTVRVPLNRTADLSRIVRTAETLRQELRREPTPEEIASSPGCRSTWCSRSRRSTPATSGSMRRSIPRAIARSSSASSPTSRATPKSRRWTGSCPRRSRTRSAPCRRATPRSCASISASMAAASTPSRRSAACSASPASACVSCATARSSACAKAKSAGL